MELGKEATIHDVCTQLEALAKNQDDLFIFSFTADGKSGAFKAFNKGDGKEGAELPGFKGIRDIIFTDTANKVRCSLLEYMKTQLFNPKNGDGELAICFDGRTRTMHIAVIHNSNLGPALGGLREKEYSN